MLLIVFTKIGLVFRQTIWQQSIKVTLTPKLLFAVRTSDITGAKAVFFCRTVIFLPQGALLYI